MAQLAKCLLNKHGDLRSIPRTHVEKLGVVACARNYSAGEAEAGASKPSQIDKFQASKSTLLK